MNLFRILVNPMKRTVLATLALLVLAGTSFGDDTGKEKKTKPAAKVDKPAEKSSDKPAEKADKPANKATDKSTDKPAEKPATKPTDKPASKPQPAIPADREAAAIEFARANHPELAALLDGLKLNAPGEYRAALIDLDRAVERISKFKDKSPERYEYEIAEWKITSRIRLLAARLTMSDDPVVEGELRAALRERLELRTNGQKTERDRLQARADKLNQSIDELSSKMDATVEKQFAELRKTLPAKPAVKNKAKKPAADDRKGDK